MLTKRPWLILSICALFFLALGILVEICVKDWPLIKLKPEVDVFAAVSALISIGVTLLVAYWVTTVLEKRNSDDRTEKDIIIRHFELIYSIIEQTRSKIQEGSINYTLVASSSKRIYMNVGDILKILGETLPAIKNTHESEINTHLAEFKRLTTDTSPANTEITVEDGIVHFTPNQQILDDAELDKIRSALFKLELQVNKG
jgi:hypothetical protein